MFVKFVDASAHVKNATGLCELLEDLIQNTGVALLESYRAST
jgi:hypothetical protein